MKQQILNQVEKLINGYIQLDPYAAVLMQPLDEKIVALSLNELPGEMYLKFNATLGKVLLTASSEHYDVMLKGSIGSLAALSLSKNKAAVMGQGKVKINGDIDVAEHFQKFWQQLHIDWEEHLAKFIGDPLANLIGKGGRMLTRAMKHTQATLINNLAEYIHEEIRYFPPREEIADFNNDVDKLRLDIERITARIERLQHLAGSRPHEHV